MRLILCLISLLCGCSSPAVRCDARLLPINPPVAGHTLGAAAQTAPARRTP